VQVLFQQGVDFGAGEIVDSDVHGVSVLATDFH
jgi:hypothetical protein